jgi:hypothetical protein
MDGRAQTFESSPTAKVEGKGNGAKSRGGDGIPPLLHPLILIGLQVHAFLSPDGSTA